VELSSSFLHTISSETKFRNLPCHFCEYFSIFKFESGIRYSRVYLLLTLDLDSNEKEDKEKFEKISARYKKVSEEHGAEIKGVYYITRSELFPSLYENADFSVDTVKASIREGELKTSQKLRDIEMG